MAASILQFDGVATEAIPPFSGAVPAGATARVVCALHESHRELATVLSGLQPPRLGRLRVFGDDMYRLSSSARLALFQRIAVVPRDGGFISNLKVWENVALPAWYHRAAPIAEIEARMTALFGELEIGGSALRALMAKLPDQLTVYEQRAAAFVRAMAMEPDIIVYDAVFAGLDRQAAGRLLRSVQTFHGASANRVSLLLLPDEPFSERVPAEVTITPEM